MPRGINPVLDQNFKATKKYTCSGTTKDFPLDSEWAAFFCDITTAYLQSCLAILTDSEQNVLKALTHYSINSLMQNSALFGNSAL